MKKAMMFVLAAALTVSMATRQKRLRKLMKK